MDAALDHLVAQGFHDVTLWVLDANDVGRQFYERYGWTNEDITKVDRIGDTDVIEIRYRLNLADR